MAKANGTVAKDIAIYFLDMTTDRYTPSMVAKTIIQAKQLLESGYKKDEIISVIDYIINKTNINMYSLGYVNSAINDVLKKIEEENKQEEVRKILEQARLEQATTVEDRGEEVDESSKRNREKFNRNNLQSRKRTKFDFNMLEE